MEHIAKSFMPRSIPMLSVVNTTIGFSFSIPTAIKQYFPSKLILGLVYLQFIGIEFFFIVTQPTFSINT